MNETFKKVPFFARFVLLAAFSVALSCGLSAQEATGRILGVVYDPTGAVVAGAHVVVTNTATHISRETSTDTAGFYQVLALSVGQYTVAVDHKGFSSVKTSANALDINQSLKIDIKMPVGSATETISVETTGTLVETVSPTIGVTISSNAVQDLPLNGRNALDLALLQPGVMETNPGSGAAGTYDIAGGRSDSVLFLLDGGVNTNLLSNGVVFNPNPDAIQEFKILENNYAAEYGRNGGGVVSMVTKSGTNALHMTAYDYIRNEAFNANDYFSNKSGLPRGVLKRHQFGATVGGPVVIPHLANGRDKLFFFSAYQGQRLTQTLTTAQFGVYTPAELSGDFSHSGAGGVPDPSVVAFLNNHTPYQPNAALRSLGIIDPTKIDAVTQKYIAAGLVPSSATGQMISRGLSKQDTDELINKLDFDITSNDKLQATIATGRAPTLTPFSGGSLSPLFPINGSANRYFGSLAYTKIFSPNLLNVARFTAQRIRSTQAFPATQLPKPTDLGIGITPDESTGPPRIFLAGAFTLGFSPQGPTTLINNTFDYSDTLSWTHGRHNYKFGFSFVPYQNNTNFDFFVDGEFDFDGAGAGFSNNSKADFLFGLPDAFTQFGKAPSNIRSKAYYAFGQDEWKITRNLVLTFGLRYEYSSPKLDTQGRSFNLQLGANSQVFSNAPTGLLFPGDPGAPKGANFPDKNDFAPRFGFAWDPFSDGKTSVRGGFGVFYDILKGEDNLQFNGQAPFFGFNGFNFNSLAAGTGNPGYLANPFTTTGNVNTFPSKPPAPNIDFAANGFLPFGGGGVFFVDPHLRTPYVMQYNLSVQRELAPKLSLETTYVGSIGRKLTDLVDTNPFILGTTNRVFNVQPGARPNTLYSFLDTFENVAYEYYNGLEVALNKQVGGTNRFFGQSYFTLAYTWSHGIDNASGFRERDSRVPFYNHDQFRASSDFDIRQRFVFSSGWDLPFAQLWQSGPKRLTQGWSLYSIISDRTGFPLDVLAGFARRRTRPGPSGAGDCNLVRANLVGPIQYFDPKSNPNATYFGSGAFSTAGLACGSAAVAAGAGTYGTAPRNLLRGPGRFNTDLALSKSTPIAGERFKLTFRAELFNIFNNVEFRDPNTTFAGSAITGINTNPNFGKISTTYDPRIAQLAMRLTF
jgi:Carboxypeptidase regulatory-like domain/TonB-dependent Receptor Plug Domain/TonB dependent receptor